MRNATKTELRKFWNSKGYYMVLLLCAAAIGISGYLLFFSGSRDALEEVSVPAIWDAETSAAGGDAAMAAREPILVEIPDYARRETQVIMTDDYLSQASGEAELPVSKADTITGGEPEDAPSEEKLAGQVEAVSGTAEIPISEKPEATETEKPAAAEIRAPFFVWPVNGEVLADYSEEELVFNSTTGDWRVHTGVDIAAAAGTHVGAIGDGIVEDVYEDEMMGWTVVINHGDGLRSVLCGLMPDIPVEIGETVRAGTVIGGVGGPEALPCEAAISSHLHLECIGGGAQIDPLEVLP